MTAANLTKAIEAVSQYAIAEEIGVEIVNARCADMAGKWVIVEGVRRAFRRVYVVDCTAPNGFVVEVLAGSRMTEEQLIRYAQAEIERG